MNKQYYDFCYEILSHYLNFPDVADTFKSIEDGVFHLMNYPQDNISFMQRRNDFIAYIIQARKDNLVYTYCQTGQLSLPIGVPTKSLWQANRIELLENLEAAVSWLKQKGMHQLIKHYNPAIDDFVLAEELFQHDTYTIVARYNLQ